MPGRHPVVPVPPRAGFFNGIHVLRPQAVARRFLDVGHLARRRHQQDHLGSAVPDRPALAERLQVPNRDRGVHQRHQVRARTAGQGDWLGGW